MEASTRRARLAIREPLGAIPAFHCIFALQQPLPLLAGDVASQQTYSANGKEGVALSVGGKVAFDAHQVARQALCFGPVKAYREVPSPMVLTALVGQGHLEKCVLRHREREAHQGAHQLQLDDVGSAAAFPDHASPPRHLLCEGRRVLRRAAVGGLVVASAAIEAWRPRGSMAIVAPRRPTKLFGSPHALPDAGLVLARVARTGHLLRWTLARSHVALLASSRPTGQAIRAYTEPPTARSVATAIWGRGPSAAWHRPA